MEHYQIRSYKTEDYLQISLLWEQTGLGNRERGDDDRVISETLNHGGAFYVMELANTNEIIGTSWITNDGRRLYLHHFGILPKFQGKGYSHPLLKKSLDYAQQLNLQIKLEVHKQNIIAENLYKKAGFSYLGDYKVLIIRNHQKNKY